jgi:hypothetical protein
MLDNASVTTTITRLIAAGVPERELLPAVARRFPDLTRAEFAAALQDATAAAERKALRPHGGGLFHAGAALKRLHR